MAAISPKLATTLPLTLTLRPPPRRLASAGLAASLRSSGGAGVVLRGFRYSSPLAGEFLWIENVTYLQRKTQMLQNQPNNSKTNLLNTNATKRNSTAGAGNSNSSGPPLLTILAGIIVFLLVCWIIGSIIAWLVGLISSVARS